jgi:hypothetical protein
MTNGKVSGPPRWVFTVVMVGGLVACGVYIGMMRVQGASAGHLARAAGFGLLGFLMLWGVLARR